MAKSAQFRVKLKRFKIWLSFPSYILAINLLYIVISLSFPVNCSKFICS
jgi:hypothetical protein